jgi:signal transduction histidine kinase
MAEGREAALAERVRIAREVHDVLAHSIAGLSIQLEVAHGLLAERGDREAALARIERAHRLAVEGQAETKRAIAALRGDARPVAAVLAALVEDYGERASFSVGGAPRELSPEAELALQRVAQEALTNARKHAAGARVDARLDYRPGETVLTIDNDADGASAPLAAHGGGYGLEGMRERAALIGGRLTAAPAAGGWRVELRLPV